MSLDINYKNSEQQWDVVLDGEIDIHTANEFKETLFHLCTLKLQDIKLNCTHLKYVDSTGFGVLIGVLKKLKVEDKRIIIENPADNVLRLLKITGLDKIFSIK